MGRQRARAMVAERPGTAPKTMPTMVPKSISRRQGTVNMARIPSTIIGRTLPERYPAEKGGRAAAKFAFPQRGRYKRPDSNPAGRRSLRTKAKMPLTSSATTTARTAETRQLRFSFGTISRDWQKT